MEIVQRIQGPSNRGFLFSFALDEVSPDEPDSARVRDYFVLSTDSSSARAYCYLFISLCEIAADEKLSRWLALYCRLFGVITCDSFLKLLLSVAKTGADTYAFFTDECEARWALDALSTSNSWLLGGRGNGRESMYHLVQTPRDAETVDRPALQPKTEEVARSTSSAVREMLEERLRESQFMLQEEKSSRAKDVATLRAEIASMEKQMKDLVQDHWSQLQHRLNEHQNNLLSLKGETTHKEAELHRSYRAMLEYSERQIHRLMEENESLGKRHHEARIELERWRIECQELKHRLNTILVTDRPPIDSVSRDQYKDLERRHRILHREFDDLSAEKREVEQLLQSRGNELRLRCVELERALVALNSIGKGLDNVRFELPLVVEDVRAARAL